MPTAQTITNKIAIHNHRALFYSLGPKVQLNSKLQLFVEQGYGIFIHLNTFLTCLLFQDQDLGAVKELNEPSEEGFNSFAVHDYIIQEFCRV